MKRLARQFLSWVDWPYGGDELLEVLLKMIDYIITFIILVGTLPIWGPCWLLAKWSGYKSLSNKGGTNARKTH